MAALSTTANGGLIPQNRHGGKGMEVLALPVSKFEGTGLEKEQMVHIHVALEGGKGVERGEGRKGLWTLETGDEDEAPAVAVLLPAGRMDSWPL